MAREGKRVSIGINNRFSNCTLTTYRSFRSTSSTSGGRNDAQVLLFLCTKVPCLVVAPKSHNFILRVENFWIIKNDTRSKVWRRRLTLKSLRQRWGYFRVWGRDERDFWDAWSPARSSADLTFSCSMIQEFQLLPRELINRRRVRTPLRRYSNRWSGTLPVNWNRKCVRWGI